MDIAKSTRREKSRKLLLNNRGVEPVGENSKIWKLKWDMNTMFERGRLKRGTVPPSPRAEPRT